MRLGHVTSYRYGCRSGSTASWPRKRGWLRCSETKAVKARALLLGLSLGRDQVSLVCESSLGAGEQLLISYTKFIMESLKEGTTTSVRKYAPEIQMSICRLVIFQCCIIHLNVM